MQQSSKQTETESYVTMIQQNSKQTETECSWKKEGSPNTCQINCMCL